MQVASVTLLRESRFYKNLRFRKSMNYWGLRRISRRGGVHLWVIDTYKVDVSCSAAVGAVLEGTS
jgi:hypothetical protein